MLMRENYSLVCFENYHDTEISFVQSINFFINFIFVHCYYIAFFDLHAYVCSFAGERKCLN